MCLKLRKVIKADVAYTVNTIPKFSLRETALQHYKKDETSFNTCTSYESPLSSFAMI